VRKRSNYQSGDAPSTRGDPFPGDPQFIGALHRGLEILRCFRVDDGSLGNQELAERSGLPKATVSRLTYTLSKLGYLVYLNGEGKYRMGVPVLGLGYACLGGMKIRETAQPHMQELADYAGDGALVSLGGRDDLSIIYVACARSPGVISLQLNVGSRISMARSSVGRAYLAAVNDGEREALMARLCNHYGAQRWPKIRKSILASVEEIRTRGFCLVRDWAPQVNAVGVPFRYSQSDASVLAFTIGGPSYALTAERLRKDLGPRLVDMANKVASFGYSAMPNPAR
jgi:DNA-binding IclR family transcriptional regulator